MGAVMRKYAYVRSKGYQALPYMDIAHVVVLNLDLGLFWKHTFRWI